MDRYRDRTDTIRTVLIHLENVQRCTTQSCCTLASLWLIRRAVASRGYPLAAVCIATDVLAFARLGAASKRRHPI